MTKASPHDLAYGRHPVTELLQTRPEAIRRLYVIDAKSQRDGQRGLSDIVKLAHDAGIETLFVRAEQAQRRLGSANHQGVFAEVAPFDYTPFASLLAELDAYRPPARAPLYVVLDCVQDPHNLGALARSALALGASAIVVPQDRAAQVTPAAFRTSAGALAHLAVARVTNLARALNELAERGVQVIGTSLRATLAPDKVDATGPTALVLGNEERGMRPQTERRCTALIRIPIAEIGSLNVGAAGAICLYEVARQRTTQAQPKKRPEVAY